LVTPIWRQAGQSFETDLAGFFTASGRAFSIKVEGLDV
jgi:hypothetical protein